MSVLCFLKVTLALVAASTDESDSDLRCGGYTLYVALLALEADVGEYKSLEDKLAEPPTTGYSLGQLARAAESYGLQTLGVQTSLENLTRRPGRFACIARIRGNHFVNVLDVQDGIVAVVDPPRQYTLPAGTFRSQWDGTALLVSRQPLLAEEDLPRPFPWRWLIASGIAALALYTGWFVFKKGRSQLGPSR